MLIAIYKYVILQYIGRLYRLQCHHGIETHSFYYCFQLNFLSQRSESPHVQTRELCLASKYIKTK